MAALNLSDLLTLLTLQGLRRAERGADLAYGQFFDDGHLVGLLRSDVLDALAEQGLVELSVQGGTARCGSR